MWNMDIQKGVCEDVLGGNGDRKSVGVYLHISA